jgi:hypothetical protein
MRAAHLMMNIWMEIRIQQLYPTIPENPSYPPGQDSRGQGWRDYGSIGYFGTDPWGLLSLDPKILSIYTENSFKYVNYFDIPK